jgi:hypothetical protein
MEFELGDASASDIIAMNLTMAALDQWLKNVSSERSGEDIGREIAAMYREIHAAVDEMSPDDEEADDDYLEDEDDEEDEEEDEGSDERD